MAKASLEMCDANKIEKLENYTDQELKALVSIAGKYAEMGKCSIAKWRSDWRLN